MSEKDLYLPMVKWLEKHLKDKFDNSWEIIVVDTSTHEFGPIANFYGVNIPEANGIPVKVDIVGFAKKDNSFRLYFIEAKTGSLDIRDLGQLWVYCQLFRPEEAFLMTDGDFGQLMDVLVTSGREDLLEYGDENRKTKMKVTIWDKNTGSPDMLRMIPARN